MKHLMARHFVGAGILLAAVLPFFTGCEINSADSTIREVGGADFSGHYDQKDGGSNPFVSPQNSGQQVTYLQLIQNGSELEAFDNVGFTWRGSIVSSDLGDTSASAKFILEGKTSHGNAVTINGTLTGSGTTATMMGSWIEPNLYAYVEGDAQINPIPTNKSVSISPSGSISLSTSGTQNFTASGGSGSYTWTVSNSGIGSVSPTTGNAVTYTANGSGTQVITVTAGTSASCTITQGGSSSLSISPTSATISTDGGQQSFSVSGGVGGYTWSLADSSKGKLNSFSGSSVTYSRLTSGNNTIYVQDSAGTQQSAFITQP